MPHRFMPAVGSRPASPARRSRGALRPILDRLEERQLLAADLDVVLGDASARRVIYTDDDGTRIQISHHTGTATVHFSGTDIQQSIGNRDIELTGTGITIDSIAYANTNFRSATQIKTSRGGDGATSLGRVTGSTPVGRLDAGRVSLVGDGIHMTGNGVIASVLLADVRNGADISMTGNAPRRGHTLRFALIDAGTEMAFASGIHSLSADSWLDGTLTAAEARTVRIGGNVSGDWTLSAGGARNIRIGGSVISGAWQFAALLSKLTVQQSFAADVTATSYRNVTISRDFTGSLTSTAAGGTGITRLTVKGASTNARVASVADVKKLTFDDIANLQLYVGLPVDWPGGLPGTTGDFARAGQVKRLTVKGTTTGALFAADRFKKISMRTIDPGGDFELAARHVRRASMRLEGHNRTYRNDRIFSDAPNLTYLNFVQLA